MDDALREEKRRCNRVRRGLVLGAFPALLLVVAAVLQELEVLPPAWLDAALLRCAVLGGGLLLTALLCLAVGLCGALHLRVTELRREIAMQQQREMADVIAAMAETPNVMHQLHRPLQSGSDKILRAMRRSYRSAKFLDILRKVREAMPDAQISTDIIVGFPGETDEDFEATMDVVRQARFQSAFSFEYSPRPGTPAAEMLQVPHEVVQERFDRLVKLQEQITEEELAKFEGRDVEVMITGSQGMKDSATHGVTGRERTGVLVHIVVPDGEPMPQIGDFVTATVTHAGRHNLIADPDVNAGQTYAVRR